VGRGVIRKLWNKLLSVNRIGENIMTDPEYESFKKMPIENLIARAAGGGIGSTVEKAKFVYGERMMEQQHEYTKQQIELQHIKNTELLNKQLRWIKFSAILNAIALLAAVVLGWFLSEWKSLSSPSKGVQQTIQSQKESSTQSIPATHPERKNGKVSSSQPPKKDEIHK
jgi:hypothetical protein